MVHLGICRSTTSVISMSISHRAGDQHWQMRQAASDIASSQTFLSCPHQRTTALYSTRARPHLAQPSTADADKHERLCAAAARLRPERRRSATPDYAVASMHSGARRVLIVSTATGLACVPPHGYGASRRSSWKTPLHFC